MIATLQVFKKNLGQLSKCTRNVILIKSTLQVSRNSTLHLHASNMWLQDHIQTCIFPQELAIKQTFKKYFRHIYYNIF